MHLKNLFSIHIPPPQNLVVFAVILPSASEPEDNINLKAYWQELKEGKEKTQRPKQKIKTKDNQSKIKIESPSINNPKTGVEIKYP